jgi:hypothetical protein|tara:strand:- start:938 stop:1108 length:171 start_codon:yes stop_codon:yes gene_type:complete
MKKNTMKEQEISLVTLEKRIAIAKTKLFSKGKTLFEVISENLIDKEIEKELYYAKK